MLPLSRPGNLSTLLFSAFWEQVGLSTTAQYLYIYYLPSWVTCQVHCAGLLRQELMSAAKERPTTVHCLSHHR